MSQLKSAIGAMLPRSAQGRAPLHSQLGETEPFATIPGETIIVRVRSREVGGRYCVIESIAEPLTSPPMHYHREDEIFHILDGTVSFCCGGKTFDANPGAVVVVPAGVHHSWANLTEVPTRMMVTFTPGGIDELLAEMDGLSLDALAERAARYGSFIVGPPLVP
jgi:mannose-6-phosphate isomerase-like protein (cupin superfamily)